MAPGVTSLGIGELKNRNGVCSRRTERAYARIPGWQISDGLVLERDIVRIRLQGKNPARGSGLPRGGEGEYPEVRSDVPNRGSGATVPLCDRQKVRRMCEARHQQ